MIYLSCVFSSQLYFCIADQKHKKMTVFLYLPENVFLTVTTLLKPSTWKIVSIIYTLWKESKKLYEYFISSVFISLSNVKMNITEVQHFGKCFEVWNLNGALYIISYNFPFLKI